MPQKSNADRLDETQECSLAPREPEEERDMSDADEDLDDDADDDLDDDDESDEDLDEE